MDLIQRDHYEQLVSLSMSSSTRIRVKKDGREGWMMGYQWNPSDLFKRIRVRFTPYGTATWSVNNHISTILDGKVVTVESAPFWTDELELLAE